MSQKATFANAPSKIVSEREVEIAIPPDGGWGWLVVVGAFFSYFISDGLQYAFGIFLKDMAEALGCSESKVSLSGAINSCVFCVTGPITAALVNRFGYRTISIVGCILATIACQISAFCNDISLIIFFYGLFGGFGFGMIYVSAMVAVGFYFERWRALATGLSVSGAGIGAMTLPQIFSRLLKKLGWRNTFRILGCFTFILISCSLLFKPIKPTKVFVRSEVAGTSEADNMKKKSKLSKPNSAYKRMVDGKVSTIKIVKPKILESVSSELLHTTTYDTVLPSIHHENLEEPVVQPKWKKFKCCKRRKKSNYLERPMYREDILYIGSLKNLPEYQKSMDSKAKSIEYQLSITREIDHEEYSIREKKTCCPIAVKRVLATMLDFRLMKTRNFVLLVCSSIFSSFGFYTPYMFVRNKALLSGMSATKSSWLISTMGIANTTGRLSCGLLATLKQIKPLPLGCCMLFFGGISSLLSTISTADWFLFTYCGIYGFSMASMSALRTVIIVEMFGLEKLSNAVGMIFMFQGIATLIGTSTSGHLIDLTGTYSYSFYFAGSCIIVGGTFLLVLIILRYKKG